jgi:hypothetical protein
MQNEVLGVYHHPLFHPHLFYYYPHLLPGDTSLHTAVSYGHLAGVEALLAYGVDLFSVDDYGYTAGNLAILYGHPELAALIGAEAQRREIIATERKCIAFAMGMHKRLGVGSCVQSLNPDLLKIVGGFM